MPSPYTYADTEFNLKPLFDKVNELEKKSPGLFKESMKKDSIDILSRGSSTPSYVLALYLSKLESNIEDSYEAGAIDVGNQKHELLQQLFIQFKPQLESGGWIDHTLVDMAQADFIRWIYTNEENYKKNALRHFQAAEEIDFEKAKRTLPSKSSYIARNTAIINANKKPPLTPQQLRVAAAISFSAYQHIAMYEKALSIKAKLKASQDELSVLAREGLNVYYAANQRIQPNTLDRAYWGVLMNIENYLDEHHFAKFQKEYDNAYTAAVVPRKITKPGLPYTRLKDLVETGKMDEAIKAFDEYERFILERIKDGDYTSRMDMEKYKQRCPKMSHPILDKLAAYDPERINLYNQKICNAFQKILEAQGKWQGGN